jgi:RNase H-like domain found in reverse transcriptase/Integrase zinc binding domain
MQEHAPVAFYSRKLNVAQKNYTVGEKELLSVVATLKEYRTMLYGCPNIYVYTDHKNNTFQNLQTQRVLRWQLFLEDYAVQFRYINSESNSLADALSRLSFDERQNPPDPDPQDHLSNHYDSQGHYKNLESFTLLADDDDLIDLFVHLPLSENVPFVLDYQLIAQTQIGDAQLQQLRNRTPAKFQQQLLTPNFSIWCYTVDPNQRWKIYLPDALLEQAIQWYHLALSHIGTRRLTDTMSETFYNRQLCLNIEAVLKHCEHCQKYKNVSVDMVKPPPERQDYSHGVKVAVDMIGPWTLEVGDRKEKFSALTIIDLVTNLMEIVRVNSKTTAAITAHSVNTWLARYPKPMSCVHDPGSEFIWMEFPRNVALQQYTISLYYNKESTSKCHLRMDAPICGHSLECFGNGIRPSD